MADDGARILSKDEVAAHKSDGDLWVIVDDGVYDVSSYMAEHPGGKKILLATAGKDASKQFHKYHGPNIIRKHVAPLRIGTVDSSKGKKGLFGRLFK